MLWFWSPLISPLARVSLLRHEAEEAAQLAINEHLAARHQAEATASMLMEARQAAAIATASLAEAKEEMGVLMSTQVCSLAIRQPQQPSRAPLT